MTPRKKFEISNSDTILIPELEEAAERYNPRSVWTPKEIKIVETYYNRVPISKLSGYLHRSVGAIRSQAGRLGLTDERGNQ